MESDSLGCLEGKEGISKWCLTSLIASLLASRVHDDGQLRALAIQGRGRQLGGRGKKSVVAWFQALIHDDLEKLRSMLKKSPGLAKEWVLSWCWRRCAELRLSV